MTAPDLGEALDLQAADLHVEGLELIWGLILNKYFLKGGRRP